MGIVVVTCIIRSLQSSNVVGRHRLKFHVTFIKRPGCTGSDRLDNIDILLVLVFVLVLVLVSFLSFSAIDPTFMLHTDKSMEGVIAKLGYRTEYRKSIIDFLVNR